MSLHGHENQNVARFCRGRRLLLRIYAHVSVSLASVRMLATCGFPRVSGRVVVLLRYGRRILLRKPFKPTIPQVALAHKNLRKETCGWRCR
jgi:hypothetical protein